MRTQAGGHADLGADGQRRDDASARRIAVSSVAAALVVAAGGAVTARCNVRTSAPVAALSTPSWSALSAPWLGPTPFLTSHRSVGLGRCYI